MKTITFVIFILISLSGGYVACANGDSTVAQPTKDSLAGTTLTDYLAYAAENNPAVKAAYYGWKGKVQQATIEHALPNPQLQYTDMAENVGDFVKFEKQKFGVSQAFPWFGTLGAKRDAAASAAAAAYSRFESEKLKVFYQVKSAYYSYYLLGREIAITQDNFDLLTFWEKVLRAKYAASLASQPDLIKVQVALGNLENQLTSLRESQTVVESRLRSVLNLPYTYKLPFPDSVTDFAAQVESNKVRQEAFANNPDLQAMEHLVASAKSSVTAANKSTYPSFMLGAMYTDQAKDPNGSMGARMYPWEVNVGISLPIWFGKNKAVREKARASFNSAKETYVDSRNSLSAYVDRVVYQYQDADRKRELYRTGLIPKAQQALDVTYTSYQAGNSDFLSLLDAQRQLLDFQLAYETSLTTQATKLAEIEMITGKEQLNH